MITFFGHADQIILFFLLFYFHSLRFDWIQPDSDFRGAPVTDGG